MGCIEGFLQAWKKAFTFQGRARRKEYWCFSVISLLAFVALLFVDFALGTVYVDEESAVGLLSTLYFLAALVPGIALFIRRLHDVNWSGLWFLANFVPLLSIVPGIVAAFVDGTPGPNRFGPDPKGRKPASPEWQKPL